jgi:hypothetical protein
VTFPATSWLRPPLPLFEILEVISATPLAAMDPESPRQAATSEAAESSARSTDTESAIPETSGGSWDPCNLDEGILSSLEQEGRIAVSVLDTRVSRSTCSWAPSSAHLQPRRE